VPELPQKPSLEYLRKQAKKRKRERAISLSEAQHQLAREYGFASWPKLVHHVQALELEGIERALVLADPLALSRLLRTEPEAATAEIDGLPPLLVLLRRSDGAPTDLRSCARLLLDAGADPNSHTVEWGGQGRMSALFGAVEHSDLELVRMLLEHGATRDEDAFYHACEQSNTAFLDALYEAGFENLVNHKLDFEDAAGLQWFLDHGVDVNANGCLHHAISRGRGLTILTMLLDAGADPNLPWDRWDTGRRDSHPSSRVLDGGERTLGILAEQQAGKAAVGGRDGDIRQLLPLHPLDDVAEAGARADRARTERHRPLGRDVLAAADRPPPEPAKDDTPLVDDEAGVPAALVQTSAHFAKRVVQAAGRNVGADVRACTCIASLRAFERQPGACPVGLSRDVVVDPLEAGALEPRRGPRAQVSLVVVAVGDHRPGAVERSRRLAVELLERDVERARQVLVLVLGDRQHLDQLRPLLGDQPLQLVPVDRG
jgi:hypothetical protein